MPRITYVVIAISEDSTDEVVAFEFEHDAKKCRKEWTAEYQDDARVTVEYVRVKLYESYDAFVNDEQEAVRQCALSKLTEEEKQALGLSKN
jgi:hypothetical protein